MLFKLTTKHIVTIKICLCFIACLAIVITSVSGQQSSRHKVGDRIDVGGNQSVEILQVRGQGSNEEWYLQYYRGQVKESTPRWESSDLVKMTEQRLKGASQSEVRAVPPGNDKDKETTPRTNAMATANCSFDPPAPVVSSADKFSVALAKRKIYDTYMRNINGTGMAPLKIGVTFISIAEGQPYINSVKVDPGRGAERKYDGAPAGATLYPLNSKHTVCEQYRDRTIKNLVESSFVCFKNKDGNWTCPILGLPKTTALQQ